MKTVKVTCINKDAGNHYNSHEAIEKLGWINDNDSTDHGKCTRLEMVKFLEDGGEAYVSAGGKRAYLIVKTSPFSGIKYVQTVADGRESNNLLELPECK